MFADVDLDALAAQLQVCSHASAQVVTHAPKGGTDDVTRHRATRLLVQRETKEEEEEEKKKT